MLKKINKEVDAKKINKLEMESNITSLRSIANMSKSFESSKKLNNHIMRDFKNVMYKYINSDGTLKNVKFDDKILTNKELIDIFDSRLKLLMGVGGLLVTDFTEATSLNESNILSMKSTRRIINELTKIINTGKFNGDEREYDKLIKFKEDDVAKEILKMADIQNSNIKDITDLISHIHKSIKMIEHDIKITNSNTSDISYYLRTIIDMSEHLDNHLTQITELINNIGMTASDILKEIDEFKKTINNITTSESSISNEGIDKLNMISAGIIRIQTVIQDLVLSFPRSMSIVYGIELNYICEKADFLKAFIRNNLKQ